MRVIVIQRAARSMHCAVIAVSLFVFGAACRSARDETLPGHAALRTIVEPALLPKRDVQLILTGSGTRKIAAGQLLLPALDDAPDGAAIVVQGARDFVLDLTGVEIRGAPVGTELDACRGFGIVLVDCERVTIRGGSLGGYKTCIAAFDSKDLVIEDVRFDAWYGMRLASTPQAEDAADWLWPHENDEDEWMTRYGAAIALNDCRGAKISRCSGRHGQNGLLLTRTTECRVVDVDFSFLSGWGIALYRSSKNRVSHSRFDYCVRGYSHDVYWRGQDSAGILLFERSSDNVFVENSATHSGDGVFLFGGRDVVDGQGEARGERNVGGSDRNVFYRNDFSFAVANSIEATFSSDNWIIENRLGGSHQHGVWGGYSTRLVCLWNEIQGTRGCAISIEHGVDCALVGNRIEDSDVGLELWWDEDPEFVDGAYGKRFDTSSRGHLVLENRFANNAKDVEITASSDIVFAANSFEPKPPTLSLLGVVVTGENAERLEPRELIESLDGALPSGRMRDVSIARESAQARASFERAKAWRAPSIAGSLWSYSHAVDPRSGLDTIVMGEFGPWDFRSKDPRPTPRAFGGMLANSTWQATWFAWQPGGGSGSNTDPRRDLSAWRALAKEPLAVSAVQTFVDPFGGSKSVREAVGMKHFGLLAKADVFVPTAGTYVLRVTSDDGVRVIVDGAVVLENWTWHAPTSDEVQLELARGRHEFNLEYFQIDGAAALAVELVLVQDSLKKE
ncbi:MAG: right-handed parallel beta-helix repeat-containing protein [Planctomycetota bacterium]|nr:right-handed parallel beta-helix repeat-containing protein [Planctomycetota bacterium]